MDDKDDPAYRLAARDTSDSAVMPYTAPLPTPFFLVPSPSCDLYIPESAD
jgi:hypothetical protein